MRNIFWLFPRKEVHAKTDTQYLLNLTSQGDVAWTDLDINTAGSGLVPEKAEAVIIETSFGDVGFPATEAYCILRKKGEIQDAQSHNLRPAGSGAQQSRTMIVGLDSEGRLQYSIGASGVDTAALRLRLAGWIEPHV